MKLDRLGEYWGEVAIIIMTRLVLKLDSVVRMAKLTRSCKAVTSY